jgi:hypothetical protein
MLTALILLVFAVIALILLLLAVVVAAIRGESPHERLSSRAASPLSAMVRRLLGVHVRRPANADAAREACLAWHAAGLDADGEGR